MLPTIRSGLCFIGTMLQPERPGPTVTTFHRGQRDVPVEYVGAIGRERPGHYTGQILDHIPLCKQRLRLLRIGKREPPQAKPGGFEVRRQFPITYFNSAICPAEDTPAHPGRPRKSSRSRSPSSARQAVVPRAAALPPLNRPDAH
jgi:hypothetical protein